MHYSGAMEDVRALFKGKRVTLMGLGLLGRGEGDAAFLAACGAILTVTDKKTEAELAEPVARLRARYPGIAFHLGGHTEADFTDCAMVVKAAGVPLDSPYIALARASGVPVVMSTALFAKHAREAGAIIVGVTGTRGKSTIAHMLFHALVRAGRRAHRGGNVRGISTLALLPEVRAGDVCVLELDSWQLQGFGAMQLSPDIAIFANLMPDHLNYYPDMHAYFADKANIFLFQKPGNSLFVGPSVRPRVEAARPPVFPVVPPQLPATVHLKLLGEHNRENAALAAAALRTLGLSEDAVRTGLESFEPVEGRLQFVLERNGVRFFNDNNATTPEATVAALRAFGGGILLIAGGSDKELGLEALTAEIHKRTKALFLLAGTGTKKLQPGFPDAPVFPGVDEAVRAAAAKAVPGDTVLFSPAFASFGMFKNEYERNDAFLCAVSAL